MTDLEILDRIQRHVLWLSTWMVHHANALRPNADGVKVGGHQASSASVVSLLTALYFKALRPGDLVELSTGSMGLGAVQATFGAFASRYLVDHGAVGAPERFIVMVGDAELDEGNVWEALAEEAVGRLGNVLWIVDVNRQSLDRVVPDVRGRQLPALFASFGWRVIELRWGRRLQALFARPGGPGLR
ncbi:MAG: pyruvate dehydrogenase, partial [Candidatus Rokuibacteriota bacterium]